MTKTYDFEKAKKIIAEQRDKIKSASLGMGEDWGWTAIEIYVDGKFTKELKKGTVIAGITGSCWATPVLQINYKDESEKDFDCYIDDGEEPNEERKIMVQTTGQGCLTENSNIR